MTQCLLKKISLALFLIIVVLVLLLQRSCDRNKQVIQNLQASEIEVEVWKDEQGRSHAKTLVLQSSVEALEITHKEELDSLTDTIDKLKLKNLESVVTVAATVEDDVSVPVLPSGDFHFTDGYTFFDGVVLSDSLKFKYHINVPIKLVSYRAKDKFLTFHKTHYVEAVSENPNVSFTGVSKIKIKEEKRKVGFGLNFSYGVGTNGLGFHLGVGLQYKIL